MTKALLESVLATLEGRSAPRDPIQARAATFSLILLPKLLYYPLLHRALLLTFKLSFDAGGGCVCGTAGAV